MVDEPENNEDSLQQPDTGILKRNTNLAVDETVEEKPVNILDQLFGHGNRLLTLPGSSLVINDDTRRLLALFSDGTFLVSESHKFDGRVLSFEVLARKKKLSIGKPRYVSQNELNAIYAFGERNQPISENDEDPEPAADAEGLCQRGRPGRFAKSFRYSHRRRRQHADYVSHQRYDADRNGI